MKTRFFKNIKHIGEDFTYYLFYPISKIVISRYKRKNKNKLCDSQFIYAESEHIIASFEEQLKKLEAYKIFKERENCSHFDEKDNRE